MEELHHLEGLQLAGKGEAPKLAIEGVSQRDGHMPVCPSGGLLCVGNPIAAAGMMNGATTHLVCGPLESLSL